MNWQFKDTYKNKGQRLQLVSLLRSKGISDVRVLKAIESIPRHFFIDNAFEAFAYQDKAFAISEGQTISQPFTVAKQTELLELKKGDKVLEIGTGSGYQSAVLLNLEVELYSIEFRQKLHENAKFLLSKLGYKNFHLTCGDGSLGLSQQAPFDKIIVTAGAPTTPKSLLEQLKIGGKMLIPVGDNRTQNMYRITRISEDQIEKENFGNYSFVPLVGEQGWKDKK
ncbi:MAG: protein-L-isoaspartate(D-aspartate) O-methyltransferase [Arenicella sp.]